MPPGFSDFYRSLGIHGPWKAGNRRGVHRLEGRLTRNDHVVHVEQIQQGRAQALWEDLGIVVVLASTIERGHVVVIATEVAGIVALHVLQS